MVLQVATQVRNAMLEQIENIGSGLSVVAGTNGVTGTQFAPTLEIRTGAAPATPATADSGNLLASLTLPPNFMATASGGSVALSGTWQDTSADAAGTVGHFRIKTNASASPNPSLVVAQGSCGVRVQINTSSATAANGNVLTFTSTAGVAVGMSVAGTGVPTGTSVVAFNATTVTMSQTSTAGVGSGIQITFDPDLVIDTATIALSQQVTVTAFTVATQNG